MNWGKHFKRWWWLYAIIGAMILINLIMLAVDERNESRKAALANPQIMSGNHELIATIGDCKIYQLISQKHVKVAICETSHASVASN
ncbi:hypothetical protein [Streptomyces sp. CHB9.2]|uniref:hypothetical protein n=1 Tax=Streptomyces sp. CHB9.2 TaxID=2841670 RepID=UPI0020960EA2|nr:hypothetical protein [Streptomyces sp. CHB9.2]MCO6704734.1 hypothetical protein [Streptomyces sp. CHB9.2]